MKTEEVSLHELLRHVLETRQRTLGADHPDTLLAMHNLSATAEQLGRDEEAVELNRKVAAGRERAARGAPHGLRVRQPDAFADPAELRERLRLKLTEHRVLETRRVAVVVSEADVRALYDTTRSLADETTRPTFAEVHDDLQRFLLAGAKETARSRIMAALRRTAIIERRLC